MRKLKSSISANALDLHGIKHEDAKQDVVNFVEDHWDMDVELTIITGNSIIMKGIAMNVLEEYDMPYQVSQLSYGKIVTWT
jgi:DNA-nicking Smr family endonuclease